MYSQETEFLVLEQLLPLLEPTFVDVGAEKGSFARWLAGRGFTGTAIEPLPAHAGALAELAANGAVRFVACAVDATDGERDLHIATDDSGKPLDHFHSLQPLEGDARVRHTDRLRVRCRSLASLRAEGAIPAEPGLLKVDTEGHDLHVLRGLGALRPAVVMTEFFTEGLYEGWADAHPAKLAAEARRLGYIDHLAIRRHRHGWEQIDHQPLGIAPGEWGNLIFLRPDIAPRAIASLHAVSLRHVVEQHRRLSEFAVACEERLGVIQTLQTEAEKRLALINELSRKLHGG